MKIDISELLDGYADDSIQFPAPASPSAHKIKLLTMEKLDSKPRKHLVFSRRAILAACLILILASGAFALYFGFRERARDDLGVTQPEKVPEYVEYPESAPGDTPGIQLVSTFSSGDKIVAYFQVSPVTPEMAEAEKTAMGLDQDSHWQLNQMLEPHGDGYGFDLAQVEYWEEAQTALVRLEVIGDICSTADSLEGTIGWIEGDQPQAYGTVTIPVTNSTSIQVETNTAFENAMFGLSGTIVRAEVYAGYLLVFPQFETFASYCDDFGEGAYAYISKTYWDVDNNEPPLTAEVGYNRSWNGAIRTFMADAVLTYRDGSQVKIADLETKYPGWHIKNTDGIVGVDVPWFYEPTVPLVLADLASITIGGETYPLAPTTP